MGYSPAQSGLVDTYVTIMDLLAHANYTFEVEAVNGVSDLSRTQRLFAAVSIATGQAGKDCSIRVCIDNVDDENFSPLFLHIQTASTWHVVCYYLC